MQDSPAHRKILVRSPQWLGDAVVATVFLQRLKSKFPACELHVLGPAALKTVLEIPGVVEKFHPLNYPQESVFHVARRLRELKIDEAYILPRSLRTAVEVWWARIPKRIGYAGDFRKLLLTDVLTYNHEIIYPLRYLRLIGEETLNDIHPYFPVARESDEVLSSALGAEPTLFQGPLLGLAPASIAPARTWMPERFAEVAKKFVAQRGGRVLVFGSPSEKRQTAQVAAMIGSAAVDAGGRLDFPRLGAILKKCSALLANDSGLMHVASALDVPTVVLFGPSDPRFALPAFGSFQGIQHTEVPCVPCLRNTCPRFGRFHKECLTAISPDEALGVLENVRKR